MSNPKFSIVIPTRNRPQTLQYAIKSCLNQNFEDYEIIVSDNFSSPDTKNVVEKFNDDRIIFVRTKQPLAMSENWDYAISQIRGDYVILIGDDDSLLLNSLSHLDNIIDLTDERVIRWEWILYYWPDFFMKNVAGKIFIPMSNSSIELNSTEIINKVANFELHYKTLPMLYNSAVHNSILKEIRKKNNVFFHSQAPDIYSGFVIAKSVKKYLSLNTPLSIAGLSKASNGAAQLYTKENSNIKEDFINLNEKAGLTWHSKVPSINVLPAIIADSYYHAKDNLFPDEEDAIDYPSLIKNCMKELSNISQIQENDLNKIKSKCFNTTELMELIEFEYRKNMIISKNKSKLKKIISKFFGEYLKYSNLLIFDIIEINLKSLGITNAYDVSEFLKYCHFPKDIDITKTKSEFFLKKLNNIAEYRQFISVSKQYVNHRDILSKANQTSSF
jgi:glycosyltransferase involved in cell wall biosynthesis